MAYVIKNNMDSVNALKNLTENTKAQNKSLQKAASGEKINGAGDGASEYAISERMRVQVKSLDQDDQNAQNGISILNVASGAIESTINILRTMKEKAIDAANDSNSDADRAAIQKVIDQSIDQINENAQVSYNGITMLDGSRNSAVVDGGTYTHLTNEKLSTSTTVSTRIIDLLDRSNNDLGIQQTDKVVMSWVKNGETHIVEVSPLTYPDWEEQEIYPGYYDFVEVSKDHTLGTLINLTGNDVEIVVPPNGDNNYSYIGKGTADEPVYTVDGENGITVKASKPGLEGQIAGFTLSVFDSNGRPRTSVNAALDSFTETIQAQNQSEDNALVFQIGTKANQSLKAAFTDMRAAALGLESVSDNGATAIIDSAQAEPGKTTIVSNKLNVSSQSAANAAINVIENALQKALNLQTKLGAETSRLEYTSSNLVMSSENTQASESVIRDADMAKVQTEYARDSVISQAAQAMLAQANQNSNSVLSLLQ